MSLYLFQIYILLKLKLIVNLGQTIQLKEHIEPCQKSEKLTYLDENPVMINTFKHGIIQSPNYPELYSKDENCIFSLQGRLD